MWGVGERSVLRVVSCILLMLYCLSCHLVGRLGAGTTRLCAGILSVAKPISIECRMANYSNSLYQKLEEETGVKTGPPPLSFTHPYPDAFLVDI